MHVLITNDDGPPSQSHSPFILPFLIKLKTMIPTWTTQIVIPNTQKSWVGKGLDIKNNVKVSYFVTNPDSTSTTLTELEFKRKAGLKGNGFEDLSHTMMMLNTTPSACVNIALNYYQNKNMPFDLVLSGPK
jgi:tubulin---tyrosine ligase